MGVPHFHPSLCCQMKILQAKNIEPKYHGNLFVRFYLSAGNNKRIQVNTHDISSKSDSVWNESFSLECSGTGEPLNYLRQQAIVFELRLRTKMMPVLGKMGKSKLLGRVEMPWKVVLESQNMEIQKYWVTIMSVNDAILQGLKPPSLQISMKIDQGPEIVGIEKKKSKREQRLKEDGCGCKDIGGGCSYADYEIFALTAVMEAL